MVYRLVSFSSLERDCMGLAADLGGVVWVGIMG